MNFSSTAFVLLRPSLGYFVIFRPESNMQYIVILSFIFAKILASLNMFRQVWTSLEEIWLVFKNFDIRAHFTMQYNKRKNPEMQVLEALALRELKKYFLAQYGQQFAAIYSSG